MTIDFITPVVDDPKSFGEIAAANSLSDVYAMGGQPIIALNVVCFPTSCEPITVLQDILNGGASKVCEAGAMLAGGHSVQDEEPKYGLVVFGEVERDKMWQVGTARSGDSLIITKPIGTGIAVTAMKAGLFADADIAAATESMAKLNAVPPILSDFIRSKITACTDVTGFGLMGHSYEMASSSGVTIVLEKEKIPYIKETEEYSKQGLVPGGMFNNMEYLKGKYEFIDIPEYLSNIVFDPQTSGGLLISCSKEDAPKILEELNELEIKSHIIGTVTEKQEKSILFK